MRACGNRSDARAHAGLTLSAPAATTAQPTRTGTPELRVSTIADGLSHVWDLGFLPDGRMLVTERDGRLALLSAATEGASVTPVAADFGDLLVRGEGGLMGLVMHPDFQQSRRFTTCQTHTEGGRPVDVRLVAVPPPLDDTFGRLRAVRTGPDGALYVSTSNGDDDKVLRVEPA